MKKTLVVLVCIFLTAGFAGCGNSDQYEGIVEDENLSSWETVEYKDFSFDVNKDWVYERNDRGTDFYYLVENKQRPFLMCSSNEAEYPNYLHLLHAARDAAVGDGTLISDTEASYNGIFGCEMVYIPGASFSTNSAYIHLFFTIYDGEMFFFGFCFDQGDEDAYQLEIAHVFNSLKLTSGGENPIIEYDEEQTKVDSLIAYIDTIGEVSLDSGEAITNAEKAYSELSADYKNKVSNLSILETARKAFDPICVEHVVALIDSIGKVSLVSASAIEEAEKFYGYLSSDSKELVTNYEVLVTSRATYNELRAAEDERLAAAEDRLKTGRKSPGMYKVGTDLPAGEYVITGSGYFEITKDSTGDFGSIIANDNFENRTIVTLTDGQYFSFTGGRMCMIEEAPSVDLSSGKLKEGMYLVGTDVPAGEYKLVPDSGGGYMEITSNSKHSLGSISSNDFFENERYVTIRNGQYLKLSMCKMILD
jgi:hypothetical protein